MNLTTGYENRKPRIEMVPLIDVVFLLVVFFIYTIVLVVPTNNLRINLPAGKGMMEEGKLLLISINADNDIYISGEIVNIENAVKKVTEIKKNSNMIKIVIRGDRKSDLGTTIELLNLLRLAGIENVSFQLEQKEK